MNNNNKNKTTMNICSSFSTHAQEEQKQDNDEQMLGVIFCS
jgi:hypothetical protein